MRQRTAAANDPDDVFAGTPALLFTALLELTGPRRALIVLGGH